MSVTENIHTPISEAARFFHQRRGQIRFEEKPLFANKPFSEQSSTKKTKNYLYSVSY